jgi:hypothetical protein
VYGCYNDDDGGDGVVVVMVMMMMIYLHYSICKALGMEWTEK